MRAASYEILRTDCTGKAIFMDGSAFEFASEIPVLKETFDLVHQMITTRGTATCATWTDTEFGEIIPPCTARCY